MKHRSVLLESEIAGGVQHLSARVTMRLRNQLNDIESNDEVARSLDDAVRLQLISHVKIYYWPNLSYQTHDSH